MKRTRTRSIMVVLLTLAYFAGLIYHIVNLSLHSSEWVSMPQNAHIADSEGLADAGMIYDRNGIVLAQSLNGTRIYNASEAVRRACLHVVGDDSTNISTAVQTIYRSELSGYNFIFGLGQPDFIRTSNNITLTIDAGLQTTALSALGDRKGAVIVYNYKTGEILCMTSTPTYDPQNVPEDIETNDDYEGAYLNRVLSGVYPPGSTFKLVTSAAALEYIPDAENIEYNCTGSDEIGSKEFNCFSVSGLVTMREALAQSCNCYFGFLALRLGGEQMTAQAQKMGFNNCYTIDGAQTAKSIYNVSEANDNELAWSGVGQYTVLSTPINMAIISAAVANGGIPVMPYFIKEIKGATGTLKSGSTSLGSIMMPPDIAQKLYDYMDYTVETNYGKNYFCSSLDICAKTGTAEIDEGIAHAWVTGFSKDEDCPLAFAVVVEHGNSGYGVAIPVATAVLDAAAAASTLHPYSRFRSAP